MPIVIAVVLLIGSSVLGAAVGYPLLVTLAMVIATTIWVHSDSDEIDYPDSRDRGESPAVVDRLLPLLPVSTARSEDRQCSLSANQRGEGD